MDNQQTNHKEPTDSAVDENDLMVHATRVGITTNLVPTD